MIGQFCVIRTRDAGVHCGVILEATGTAVKVGDCRRIWRWRGANTLNEVALRGVDEEYSRISDPVKWNVLTEAIEIIGCTPEARKTLEMSRWGA